MDHTNVGGSSYYTYNFDALWWNCLNSFKSMVKSVERTVCHTSRLQTDLTFFLLINYSICTNTLISVTLDSNHPTPKKFDLGKLAYNFAFYTCIIILSSAILNTCPNEQSIIIIYWLYVQKYPFLNSLCHYFWHGCIYVKQFMHLGWWVELLTVCISY